MARRTHHARGQDLKLVPSWNGTFGLEMAGNVAAAERRRPDRAHHVRRVAGGRSALKKWS